MLIHSEVEFVNLIRSPGTKFLRYNQVTNVVGWIPVVDRHWWKVASYFVLLLETGDYVLVFQEDCVELVRETIVKVSWNCSLSPQQYFLSIVQCDLHAQQQMAVVVNEIRRTMLASGLMWGDELIMDVVGFDCFEVGPKILVSSPNNVKCPQIGGLTRWQDGQHLETEKKPLPLGRTKRSNVPSHANLTHLIISGIS